MIAFPSLSKAQEFPEVPDTELSFLYPNDTITISTMFDECGEFGGHQETIKIFSKGSSFHFTYTKHRADCSQHINERPVQILDTVLENKLSRRQIAYIKNYIKSVLMAKLTETEPLHSHYVYEVYNLDKSLRIITFTGNNLLKEYQLLVAELYKKYR